MLSKQFLSFASRRFPQIFRVISRTYGTRARKIGESSQPCGSVFRHVTVFSGVNCVSSRVEEVTAQSHSQRKHEGMSSSKKVKWAFKGQIHFRRQNHIDKCVEEILLHNWRWASKSMNFKGQLSHLLCRFCHKVKMVSALNWSNPCNVISSPYL